MDNVVSKFWFVRSFLLNITPNSLPKLLSKWCPRSVLKKSKARSFICKVGANFLRSSRHFKCDTSSAVIVCFLNDSIHAFEKIRNGKVETGLQTVKIGRIWKFFVKKHKLSLLHLSNLMSKIFPKLQPPIDFQDSVAPVKNL